MTPVMGELTGTVVNSEFIISVKRNTYINTGQDFKLGCDFEGIAFPGKIAN